MKMPVIHKTDCGQSELVQIDLNDVIFMRIENRNIVYHTLTDKYFHISTLSDLEEICFGLGFDLLDKTNIVNMNKIKYLDQDCGNVYFEENPGKNSKYASVAFIKQKLLKNEIARAIANNTTGELKLNNSGKTARKLKMNKIAQE